MKCYVVVGASGDVGRGIVEVLIRRGHQVVAVARRKERLCALADDLANPAALTVLPGSLESEDTGAHLAAALRQISPVVDGVVIAVNAERRWAPLLSQTADELMAVLRTDLVSHFVAARALLPQLSEGGTFLSIGGGSADFIPDQGISASVAQAGLRMLCRGLAHELSGRSFGLRELIIASVVNGATTRKVARREWVTDLEIGEQVARMLEQPDQFPDPIWRISRRDESGRPVVSAEPATRVQTIR
jgi:NAD(P)-dependent dehydrogenase (short-subunit alcohol dehydrogenase family)